jgi:glycosyltransferase involved in cell wall biosynthesis
MNDIYNRFRTAAQMRRQRMPSTFHAQPESRESKFRNSRGGPSIGFLASSYLRIGGTESFHRTLIPRLNCTKNVAGFVAVDITGGDGSLLGVPYDTGLLAAKDLASQVDVLVTWGVSDLAGILPEKRPRVISVHHADLASHWSDAVTLQQLSVIDAIVCVNPDVAAVMLQSGKPAIYIPNAIDPDRIQPTAAVRNIRGRFGISNSAKVVLFGHRLSSEKRPAFACEVARNLPDPWVMVIAGEGRESGEVERAAAASGRIVYVGGVQSLADWLTTADCFLSLSELEGFGLSIGEAMLAGVPTVSTPTGIAPGNAITLPTESSAADWAAAIVSSGSWVQPAGFADRFSIDRFVSSWVDLIREIENT